MKILLIAGHGNGDPGAVALGHKEADLTRELVALIRPTLSAYATVDVFDTNKNMYKYLQTNYFNFKDYDYVLEVHLNAGGRDAVGNGVTTGTEILVHTSEAGVSVEEAILSNLKALGFKNRGVKRRGNLLVMNTCKKQGVSHALLETFFIDDLDDLRLYNRGKTAVANAVVQGIVKGFGLASKTITFDEALNKLVSAGIIDSPDYWRNAAKAANGVKHLDTLIIKFAKTL